MKHFILSIISILFLLGTKCHSSSYSPAIFSQSKEAAHHNKRLTGKDLRSDPAYCQVNNDIHSSFYNYTQKHKPRLFPGVKDVDYFPAILDSEYDSLLKELRENSAVALNSKSTLLFPMHCFL